MNRDVATLAALVSLGGLAVACNPAGLTTVVAVPLASPIASSSVAASLAPSAPSAPSTAPTSKANSSPLPTGLVVGLVAQAAGVDGLLSGAEVKVYRLGKDQLFASGKSGTNGAFLVDLGPTFPNGAPVQIVASKNGLTVTTLATAGIVASGGGNIVATGGGNFVSTNGGGIVATGGGNIVATGGGNIVATGGGNIVASGAGNFGLLQTTATGAASPSTEPSVSPVSPAGALAFALLGPRFRGAGQASTRSGDGGVVLNGLKDLLLAYSGLAGAGDKALTGGISKDDQLGILKLLNDKGQGQLSADLAGHLKTARGLRDAFQAAAIHSEDAISAGVAGGGDTPSPDTLVRIEFAGVTADPIIVSTGALPEGSNGAKASSDNY